MPARNNRLARRIASAMLVLPLTIAPAAAQGRDSCRAIRALTNADGARFAGVSLGFAGKSARMAVRGAGAELLPAPETCSFSRDSYSTDISCFWPTQLDAGEVFDALFARFSRCLPGLTAPSGPSRYGDSNAPRRSLSSFPTPGGTTEIDLVLIDSTSTLGSYVSLSITYELADPD